MEPAQKISKTSPIHKTSPAGAKGISVLVKHSPSIAGIEIGHVQDSFENEANAMADKVMGNQSYPITAFSRPTGNIAQKKSISHRMTVVTSNSNLEEKKIQKKEDSTKSNSLTGHSIHHRIGAHFLSSLSQNLSGGEALPPSTLHFMEAAFHADFKKVRVHHNSDSAKLSKQIGAHAFTHKNHIFFNSGKYDPHSYPGKHLLAHELTHVVQQGFGGKPSKTTQNVQPSWYNSAASLFGSAVDFVSGTLDEGKRLFLKKAGEVIQKIPGYKALRLGLGKDPITGEGVSLNGHNFIDSALDLMPGGVLLNQKLKELNALSEAEAWVDSQISTIKNIVNDCSGQISRFIGSIGLDSLASPLKLIEDAGHIIENGVVSITRFAVTAATQLLTLVKKFLLKVLVEFVKNQTKLYPLLTILLKKDPITEEEVARNGENILTAFLLISDNGPDQKKEMIETGTFGKVAKWIDTGIAIFSGAYEEIVTGFQAIWSQASIDNLIHPIDTFNSIYKRFSPPVSKVLVFIGQTAITILKLIKEVLIKKLSLEAAKQQGYTLLTVILGKDPFTDQKIPRKVENLVHGFMSLMDGGEEQFNQLKESGAIARAQARIDAAVDKLNMTPTYIIGLFKTIWDTLSIKDFVQPILAFKRVLAQFGAPLKKLFDFIVEVVKIAVLVVLQIMQFPFDLINSIISRVREAFDTIKKNPVAFLKNLLSAIKAGFVQFFNKIGTHLIKGLQTWLASELKDAGVKAPTDYSFKGILLWVLDTLGITLDNIWKKIEKKIGADKVAKIKSMVDKLEGVWAFIKDVQQRGLIAVWEKIKEKLNNLWDMILDFIKGWIIDKVITKVTQKLLSMLDPTGIMAVVNSTIALYSAIQSAIKYITRILQMVNTFVGGVLEIAKGNITSAANFLETALGDGIPIMIGFLANQIGLSGLGKKVGEMIEKVREKIDGVMQWIVDQAWKIGGPIIMQMVDFAIKMGDKAAGAWQKAKDLGKKALNKGVELGKGFLGMFTKQDFSIGKASHTIAAKDVDGKLIVTMASDQQLNLLSRIDNARAKLKNDGNKNIDDVDYQKMLKDTDTILTEIKKETNELLFDFNNSPGKDLRKKGQTFFEAYCNVRIRKIIIELRKLGNNKRLDLPSLEIIYKVKPENRRLPIGYKTRKNLYEMGKGGKGGDWEALSNAKKESWLEELWDNKVDGVSKSVSAIFLEKNEIKENSGKLTKIQYKAKMQNLQSSWMEYKSKKLVPEVSYFLSTVEYIILDRVEFIKHKEGFHLDHIKNSGDHWVNQGGNNTNDKIRGDFYMGVSDPKNLRVIPGKINLEKANKEDVKFGERLEVGIDFESEKNKSPKGSEKISGRFFEDSELIKK